METYSVTNDFGGVNPNIEQLYNEIINDSNIIKVLDGLNLYQDSVQIVFDSALSAPEKTALDSLVAAHVPVFIPETPNSLNITPNKNNVKNSTFTRLSSNIFPGSTYATAKCVSYMSNNTTSYDIEIFDKDNHQILLSQNLTNTEESIQDLGVLSNLSSEPIHLEVSMKTTGGGKAYLESVIICYE